MTDTTDVLLISMPWDFIDFPSIQIGTLRALLVSHGFSCDARSYNLDWAASLLGATVPGGEPLTMKDYRMVSEDLTAHAVGDWVFAVPPFRAPSPASDAEYAAYLASSAVGAGSLMPRLHAMRELVPGFLDRCVDDILATGARVVGLTCTFGQTVAALSLCLRLKERAPWIRTVLGGSNCDGPMGEALHRCFACVDVVVRGEAEALLAPLFSNLLEGGPLRPQPGICYRNGTGDPCVVPLAAPTVALNDIPTPNYDEYFERLSRFAFAREIVPGVTLLFESARGCWWGQKSHCTFCGLEPRSLGFRAKSPDVVFDELLAQAKKYGRLNFSAVDNIMDRGYLQTLLPRLRDAHLDLTLVYETKANLKRSELAVMRDAGVRAIQPGIESLSRPILEAMRKGTTPLQNIRLLKWCAELGIHVSWNLLYGLPGEAAEEYQRMADLVPSLVHLPVPRFNRLHLDRFSPYHQRPADFGIELRGPAADRHVYPPLAQGALDDLSYRFDFKYLDGRDPENYVGPLRLAIAEWARVAREKPGALRIRRGPDFLTLEDTRYSVSKTRTLDAVESRMYLACDDGATIARVADAFAQLGLEPPAHSRIRAFLEEMVSQRYAFVDEKSQYLSLALAQPKHAALSGGRA